MPIFSIFFPAGMFLSSATALIFLQTPLPDVATIQAYERVGLNFVVAVICLLSAAALVRSVAKMFTDRLQLIMDKQDQKDTERDRRMEAMVTDFRALVERTLSQIDRNTATLSEVHTVIDRCRRELK